MMRASKVMIPFLVAAACGGRSLAVEGTGTTGTQESSTAAATTGTEPVRDASSAAAGDSTGEPSVGQGEVRFVALGDAGEGNEAQIAIGQTLATVCAERGCDFALYLGDNLYDVGASSTMDEQFELKFEIPYAPVDFPFYVTLGNHDYGIIGSDWAKSQYQVEYTEHSDKWTLPSEFYSFQRENVHFVSLDTAQLFWNHEVDAQRAFLHQDLAGLHDTWIIMFGHHPYISNGEHGNAGNYEGLGGIIGGATVKEFFEEEVCGVAHVYLCGHDHSRQWPVAQCGTEFIVSGAGSKTTGLEHRDGTPTHFEDDQVPGFLWVEIIDDSFTGVFFDRDGNPQYERTIVL